MPPRSFVFPQLIYTQRLGLAGLISQPLRCAANDETNGPVADCSPGLGPMAACKVAGDPRPWAAGACGEGTA